MDRREFTASLVAGGCAGMCVDLTLFPLDTIKTRLQSQQGFYKAGGFRGIYAGLPSAAIGSFPNAAVFFVTYESTKSLFSGYSATNLAPITHMLAASLGEIVACLIRVPTEVVKQRTQASPSLNTYRVLLNTLQEEGFRGLYRGYGSTVLRELIKLISSGTSSRQSNHKVKHTIAIKRRCFFKWISHSHPLINHLLPHTAASHDNAYRVIGKAHNFSFVF
uniref:Mitochondrial S-adenosylmethionine carrier protein n=1 Tax=Cyprinus carpio carpio TaxID=630221 RepID=A0A8C1CP12_CYPCA